MGDESDYLENGADYLEFYPGDLDLETKSYKKNKTKKKKNICKDCMFFNQYFSNKKQKEVKECGYYWSSGHYIEDENRTDCEDFREKREW